MTNAFEALRIALASLTSMPVVYPYTEICAKCIVYKRFFQNLECYFDLKELLVKFTALRGKISRLECALRYLSAVRFPTRRTDFSYELVSYYTKNQYLRDALLKSDLQIVYLNTQLYYYELRRSVYCQAAEREKSLQNAYILLLREQLKQAGLLVKQNNAQPQREAKHKRQISVVRISEMSFDV